MTEAPDFGNWIRLHKIGWFFAVSLLILGASLLLPTQWQWLMVGLSAPGFAMGFFLLFVYFEFSDRGGGVQRQLWRLTLAHLSPATRVNTKKIGKALDIGTGNGSLGILLAMEQPGLAVSGVDLWAPDWEYSIEDCRRNAFLAGVDARVNFEQASAHQLPFEDATFDYVVSHFVFHEVAVKDKIELLQEALRVLKPGGCFSFHDMFFDAVIYGDIEKLLKRVRMLEVEFVTLVDSRPLLQVSRLLMGKRILGRCGIMTGTK